MNAREVWQSHTLDAPRMSLEFVRHQANRLEWRTRWINGFNHAGGVFALGYYCWHAWHTFAARPIALAASAWFAVFAVFYGLWWLRNASALQTPEGAGVLDMIRFQRRQLVRQRDVRRNNWKWMIPPMVPGFILAIASIVIEMEPVPWSSVAGVVVIFLVASVGGTLWYGYTARRLQAEIDALDSMVGPGD